VILTLDRVILHTVVHHSLTFTYTPNFTEIEETVFGRMDNLQTDGRCQVQSHVTQKVRQMLKNLAQLNLDIVP